MYKQYQNTKTSTDNSQEEPSETLAPLDTKSQHEATLFMDMMPLMKKQIKRKSWQPRNRPLHNIKTKILQKGHPDH